MNELAAFLRAVGVARLTILITALGGVFILLILLTNEVNRPGMQLLFGNLTPEEAISVTNELETRNIMYNLRGDGSVFVPGNQVGELRLQLAGSGVVGSSNEGYAIFDNQRTFGTSSLVQNINARRALEGELARTIMSLPAVQAARVHIVMPERKAFSRDEVNPTAAVALTLGGRLLGAEQVASIAELVAAAVPELMAADVTVVDQRGNLLTSGTQDHAATFQERVRNEIEGNYENDIRGLLERVVGVGKAAVTVTAELNFDRIEEMREEFDPDGQVVRSSQAIEETATSTGTGGVVGITGNLPGGADGAAGPSDEQTRTEETTNFEISKTVRTLTREGGDIQQLSVAVLVEGGTAGADADSYQAMTEERREQLTNLVRAAIGFDQTRGDTVEIIDLPFTQVEEVAVPDAPLVSRAELFEIGRIAALILGMIIAFFFIIRPTLSGLQKAVKAANAAGVSQASEQVATAAPAAGSAAPVAASAGGGAAAMAAAPAPEGEEEMVDLAMIEGRVKESSVKKVNSIVDNYPEESLGVVRNWMAQNPRDEK